MTLPVSGAISFNNINVELGVSGTTQASLGQASYRTLAGVASGAISMSNFYGKSNRVVLSYTFASNTANASLNVAAISGYIAGKSDITITVNGGVYLYATSNGNAGLTLTGGSAGDTLTLVNNGLILGQGGRGGGRSAGAPTVGGPAFSVGFSMTVNNQSGYIAGGGGGGGSRLADDYQGGGGGAGGGDGGPRGGTYSPGPAAGGAGGGPGSSGANGTQVSYCCGSYAGSGGGGGRIVPGSGGAGGSGGSYQGKGGGAGGGGGGNGNNGFAGGSGGAAGGSGTYGGGGGGGWGASGGSMTYGGGTGAAGGKGVNLNGRSVTWVGGSASTSRIYGAVS